MGARASRPVRPFPSAWSKAGEQRHLSGVLWEERQEHSHDFVSTSVHFHDPNTLPSK